MSQPGPDPHVFTPSVRARIERACRQGQKWPIVAARGQVRLTQLEDVLKKDDPWIYYLRYLKSEWLDFRIDMLDSLLEAKYLSISDRLRVEARRSQLHDEDMAYEIEAPDREAWLAYELEDDADSSVDTESEKRHP